MVPEIPKTTTVWMFLKPLRKLMGYWTISTGERRISEPSTVGLGKVVMVHVFFRNISAIDHKSLAGMFRPFWGGLPLTFHQLLGLSRSRQVERGRS